MFLLAFVSIGSWETSPGKIFPTEQVRRTKKPRKGNAACVTLYGRRSMMDFT